MYLDLTGTWELSVTYMADSTVARICRVEFDMEDQETDDSELLPRQIISGTYSIRASRSCAAKNGTFEGSGSCGGTWCWLHLTVDLYDFGGECEVVGRTLNSVNIKIDNNRIELWGGWRRVRCGSVETSWELRGTGRRT